MFCKLIGSNRRKAEISRKERRLKEADVLDGVARSSQARLRGASVCPSKQHQFRIRNRNLPLAGTG